MGTATARTDIHRPSAPEFDPQSYRLVGVYDLHPEARETALLNREIDRLAAQGIVQAPHLAGCGHCGQTNLRYVALLVHTDAGEWIFVGQDCLAGRFTAQTKASFEALRKDAELERAKQRTKAAWLALCDEHPGIAYASYAGDIIDAYVSASRLGDGSDAMHVWAGAAWALGTLDDIARKARRNGYVSEKQVAFVERLWAEVDSKLAAQAARDAEPEVEVPPAPVGKVTVEGVIGSVKVVEGDYGSTVKMLVVADAGWRVWSTLPTSISGSSTWDEAAGRWVNTPGADKGDRVRFDATLTRSDDDPSYAFAKRPTKAQILARAAD